MDNKIIALTALIALIAPAFGQPASLTDQEIAVARTICRKAENFVHKDKPPFDAQYKPEWTKCEAIDAEFLRRDMAKKQQKDADESRLNEILEKMGK